MTDTPINNTREKVLLDTPLLAKIPSTTAPKDLEEIGALLSPIEFMNLMTAFSEKIIPIEKLDPILVGLPSDTFCIAMQSIPINSLLPLTREVISEPLLHHITVLANNCEETHRIYASNIDSLKVEFNRLNRDELDYDTLANFKSRIDDITQYYRNSLEFINRLLQLAWNSQRASLIQKISLLKTETLFQLKNEVNGSADEASNLENLLFEILSNVFVKANLKDEDPAIEGLAALSVWYLQDYWKAGLLPEIENEEALEPPANMTGAEKQEHRNQLFRNVDENLKSLNLVTVANLKNVSIFSKKMLAEYVAFKLE